ncbi:MAG: hypothetical protein ACK41T_00310 [Pseudobdellovibrio sp.]
MHFLKSTIRNQYFILTAVFVLFWSYFIFGGHLIFDMDIHSEFIPLKTLWTENIKNGIYPFWNPYSALGYPVHAGGHMGGLYPLNFIFLLFEQVYIATTYYFLIHIFIAYIGMYIFLKKYNPSFFPRFYGAVAFSFSGYIIANSSNLYYVSAICYLPLVIYFTDRLKARICLRDSIYLSLVLSIQFLTGAFPILFITVVSLLVYYYTDLVLFKTFLKRTKYILIAGVFTVLLTLPQLIPTLKYLKTTKLSQGVGIEYMTNNSLNAELLSSYFFPHVWGVTNVNNTSFQNEGYDKDQGFFDYDELHNYLGLSTIVLIFVALFSWKSLIKEQKDILVLFGVSLVLSLGFLPLYDILQKIPIFNFFKDPSKWSFITAFCLSTISAYAFSKITFKNFLASLAFVFICALFLSIKLNLWNHLLSYVEYPNCSQRSTVNISCFLIDRVQPLYYFLIGIFIIFISIFKIKFIKYTLPLMLLCDLYLIELSALPAEKSSFYESSFKGYEPLIADQPFYRGISGDFQDKEALNYQTLNSETGIIKKIHSLSTSSPLVSNKFVKMYSYANQYGVILEMSHVTPVDNLKWQNNFLKYNGVKYVIKKKEDRFYLDQQDNPNKRMFFTHKVEASLDSLTDFLDSCLEENCTTYIPISEYDKNRSIYESLNKTSDSIFHLKEYSVNEIRLDIETKGPAFFVYTDQDMDGWTITVNDNQRSVIPVNGFYKGILIKEEGYYQVTFSYVEPHFEIYFAISMIAFFLLNIYIISINNFYPNLKI